MARKQLPYDPENDEFVINGESNDISEIQDNIDDELNKIFSEIDADKDDVQFRIKIFRILKDQGERAWLFDVLPSELPVLPRLRDDYDGGMFEMFVYKGNRIFKRRKMVVEAPRKRESFSVQGNSDVENVLKYVTSGMSQLAEAIKELKTPQPQVSQMEMMTQMLTMMKLMKEIQGPQPQQASGDSMEVFMKGIDFAKDIALNGGGDVSTGQMVLEGIRTLGKPLAQMVEKINNQPQGQKPLQKQTIKPTQNKNVSGALPNPIQPTGENEEMNIVAGVIQNRLKKELPKLCERAVQGKDPGVYASVLLEEIEPAYHEVLGGFLADETWFERLKTAYPPIEKHRHWFEEMRMYILADLGLIEMEDEIDEGLSDEDEHVNGDSTGNVLGDNLHAVEETKKEKDKTEKNH